MIWLLAIAGSVLAVGMVLASPLSQWFGQSTTLALLPGGLAGLFGGLLDAWAPGRNLAARRSSFRPHLIPGRPP